MTSKFESLRSSADTDTSCFIFYYNDILSRPDGNNDYQNINRSANNRQDIWETIFNIDKLENRPMHGAQDINGPLKRVKLGFGLKTDSHMISILFERASLNQLRNNTKEMHFQKRNLNLANMTKGTLYSLMKIFFIFLEQYSTLHIDMYFYNKTPFQTL